MYKELDKRLLHITDLLKVKGVAWERRSNPKDKALGDNLYTRELPVDQDEERPETVRAYLEVMEMYLFALAIVGSEPVDPQPAEAEERHKDPSDYVVFPY